MLHAWPLKVFVNEGKQKKLSELFENILTVFIKKFQIDFKFLKMKQCNLSFTLLLTG